MRGESGGVLDPVGTLFLRGGDELTVNDDRRAGVAVVSVYAENIHLLFIRCHLDRKRGAL